MTFEINIKKLTRKCNIADIPAPAEKVDLFELVKIAQACDITLQNKNYVKEFCQNIICQNIPRQTEVFNNEEQKKNVYSNLTNALKHLIIYFKKNFSDTNIKENIIEPALIEIAEKAKQKDCPTGNTILISKLYYEHIQHDIKKVESFLNPNKKFKEKVFSLLEILKYNILTIMSTELGRKETHTLKGLLKKLGKRIGLSLSSLDTYDDKQDDILKFDYDEEILFQDFISRYHDNIVNYLSEKLITHDVFEYLFSYYPEIQKIAVELDEPSEPFFKDRGKLKNEAIEIILYKIGALNNFNSNFDDKLYLNNALFSSKTLIEKPYTNEEQKKIIPHSSEDLELAKLKSACDKLLKKYLKEYNSEYYNLKVAYNLKTGKNLLFQSQKNNLFDEKYFTGNLRLIKEKFKAIKELKNSTSIQHANNIYNKHIKLFEEERNPIKMRIFRSIELILTLGLSYIFSDSKNLSEYFKRTASTSMCQTYLTSSKSFKSSR